MADAELKKGEVVRVRLEPHEKAALASVCGAENITQSEAIRRLLRSGTGLPLPVASVDRPVFEQLDDGLRRVGINLNQAVRAMNEGRAGYEPSLDKALRLLAAMVTDLRGEIDALTTRSRKPANSHA